MKNIVCNCLFPECLLSIKSQETYEQLVERLKNISPGNFWYCNTRTFKFYFVCHGCI